MIHPTAIIEAGAVLGQDVRVGPFSIIGPQVVLQDRVEVLSHAVVNGHTVIGEGSRIGAFCGIGLPPQDIHYQDEPTRVEVGRGCDIREYVTIHRGTVKGGGLTRVGEQCMLMAYAHIAHDCKVGSHVIMANAATLGGHVEIQDYAGIGGLTAVHQFARIGRYAFVGGASAVSMDVIPFSSVAGNRAKYFGINVVGLRRAGFAAEAVKSIRLAHRVVFQANLRLEHAVEELERQFPDSPDVQAILEFIQASQRGICR